MKFNLEWPRKISWKLTLVYTLMFIIVLMILYGTIYIFLNRYLENNARESLHKTLEYVLPRVRGLDRESFSRYEAEILQDISEREGDVYFRVLDYDQNIVAQSSVLQGVEVPLSEKVVEFTSGDREFVARSIAITRFGFITGYFQVVRELSLEYKFLEKLFLILLVTGLLGSIGAIFIAYTITRKTLNPVKEITDTARSISVSDLDRRLKIEGPEDELTNLARTFNSMLERLDKAFKHQQQFVADASHELRTPISVIKGYINMLDRWGKKEAEVRDEAIEAIKNEVEDMDVLLENLLFLARGESERLEVNKEDFRFDVLVDELSRETALIAEAIEIKSRVEPVNFYGDKKLIKQMLRIFVDNSMKYTEAGGKITLKLWKERGNIKLIVSDTGRGIPQEDIPHIFDRFYRVDKSRSDKKEGSGLGLAIASWIIDLHQGEVEVQSEEGEGTEIKVVFPSSSNS